MNQTVENFFHGFSKIAIFIPLVIMVIALATRFGHRSGRLSQENISSPATIKMISSVPGLINLKINLTGPLNCDISYGSDEAKIYIKNKNVKAILTKKDQKELFLLQEDCLYQWNDGKYTGVKTCSLKPIVDIASLFPLDLKTIMQFVKSGNLGGFGETKTAGIDINKVNSLCKKEAVLDSNFVLPATILFKTKNQQ